MTVALVFAFREELRPILKESKVRSKILEKTTQLTRAEFRGTEVIFCLTGMGLAAAHEGTERLLRHFQPSLILSAGYAGGCDPSLKTGDLVIPSEIRSETPTDHFSTEFQGRERLEMLAREEGLPYQTGILCTLWKMANKKEKEIWQKNGGMAVDMESAAVAAVAAKKRIPFVSLRVIFDTIAEELNFKHPKSILQIPKFIRMNLVCQRNLARVLARFVELTGIEPVTSSLRTE